MTDVSLITNKIEPFLTKVNTANKNDLAQDLYLFLLENNINTDNCQFNKIISEKITELNKKYNERIFKEKKLSEFTSKAENESFICNKILIEKQNKEDEIIKHEQFKQKEYKEYNLRFSKNNKPFVSFAEAKDYAISLGIKYEKNWIKHIKENKLSTLPICPDIVYKNSGWRGWDDFMGYKFLSFSDCKQFIQQNYKHLNSSKKYLTYVKTKDIPLFIPKSPQTVYSKEWKGWSDFLNTYNTNGHRINKKKYLSILGQK